MAPCGGGATRRLVYIGTLFTASASPEWSHPLAAAPGPAAEPPALQQQALRPSASGAAPLADQKKQKDLFGELSQARHRSVLALADAVEGYIKFFCRTWGIPLKAQTVQRNDYSDPGFTTSGRKDEEVAEFMRQVVKAFPESQAALVDGIQSLSMKSGVADIYANAVRGRVSEIREPFFAWEDFFKGGAHKADVKAGGGFGFGFQVYCGCNLVLSTGMGFGSGLDAQNRGGFGGGGGLQIFQGGQQRATLGGGGGGDLAREFGASEDDGQAPQSGTLEDLQQKLLAPQISACPKGKVSVVGGGGAGLGFAVTIEGDLTQFGGGLDFKMASDNFAQNDRACGGRISRETQKDNRLDEDQKQCRIKCNQDPSTFNGCFCTCTRQAYLRSGHSWATHMRCTGSLAAEAAVLV